jgi:enterochelin esterase-like enzyme
MRPTRSHRRTVFPLSAALLFCALVTAQNPDPPPQGKATLVYSGTGGNKGKGIHLFRLQPVGAEVSQNKTLGLAAETPNLTSAQQPTNVRSPEIGADRRVTFRLNAPKAQEVVLTGEFLKGGKLLLKDANGVWSVTVGPIEPEIYHYNFTVDGVRIVDHANPNLKTGSTASTLASVLEVRGDAPAFYDGQNVPHGEIRTHFYHSKSLGSLRRLTVYTPPRYERESQTRYPVVYLLHGANADETAWYRLGRVNFILDNLLAAAKIKPFIVVMPFGYGVSPGGPQAENTAKFGKDLVEDVIPYIEAHYRTFTDCERRAIVGLSMGGGQALNIGLNNLDLFSHVAGFSSGLGNAANFPKTYASLTGQPETANRKIRLLWVGCGNEDSLFAASKAFSEFLTKHNIKHTFRESGGAHTWMVWRRYMHEIAPLLFFVPDQGAKEGKR